MESPSNWKSDAKLADPSVLPEYTALPESPSITTPPPSTIIAAGGASQTTESTQDDPGCGAEGCTILKVFWKGVLAIVLPPAIITAAAVACACAMLYGCGKLLEGIGRALAIGPQWMYRACVKQRAKKMLSAFDRRRSTSTDIESPGAIAI